MKKRFTEGQIIGILKDRESGIPVKDLIRRHGISEQTYYRWKSKYGGMEVNEARRLKELERENLQLKQIIADQALDIKVLRDINSKNW